MYATDDGIEMQNTYEYLTLFDAKLILFKTIFL